MFLTQAACTLIAASLAQVPGATNPQEGWDKLAPLPAGQATLELRLSALREAYPLGKPTAEKSKQRPAPVVVVFELKNTGKKPLELRGPPEPSLALIGPDGKPATPFVMTSFYTGLQGVFTLAPGETVRLPFHRLAFRLEQRLLGLRWTGPGDHQLQGDWTLSLRNTGVAKVSSNTIKLSVEAGDEAPFWTNALEDRNADVRFAAAKFLQMIEPADKSLVSPLVKALDKERETNVLVALMQALERLGTKAGDSVGVLRKQLKSADIGVRSAAVVALARVGPKDKTVVNDFLRLLHDPHAQVRRTLAEHFSTMLHNDSSLIQPEIVAALRQAVAVEPDDVALSYVIRTLGKVPEPVVIRDLLPHLESELQTKHRYEAVVALGNVIFWMPQDKRKARDDQGNPIADTVSALMKLLRDNDPARAPAIYSLMQIGPDAAPAVPLLIAEVQKPGKKEDWNSDRLYAVRALGAIGPAAKAAVEVLVEKGLRDENWQLRESAVTALGKIKGRLDLAVPALTKMFTDEREFVAVRAIEALVEIGPDARDALPALRKLAERTDSGLATAALAAIKQIDKR